MRILDLISSTSKPFCSLEFFPPKDLTQWDNFFNTVEKLKEIDPLFASVTYGAGGSSQDATIEIATRIKSMSLEPMPHFTCVGASQVKIEEFLKTLEKNKIDNVLALRGDPPKGQEIDWSKEPFQHAEDLIHLIKKKSPNIGIAAAAYPTPHPEATTFALDKHYTNAKAIAGAEVFITQLFFDVREYIALKDSLYENGKKTPLIPGILPIMSLSSLRRTMSLCGASLPAQFYFALEDAYKDGGDEAVKELGIQYAINQIKQLLDLGAPGIHLYTLNKADLCMRIARACF